MMSDPHAEKMLEAFERDELDTVKHDLEHAIKEVLQLRAQLADKDAEITRLEAALQKWQKIAADDAEVARMQEFIGHLDWYASCAWDCATEKDNEAECTCGLETVLEKYKDLRGE
jgi:hypothetical protein